MLQMLASKAFGDPLLGAGEGGRIGHPNYFLGNIAHFEFVATPLMNKLSFFIFATPLMK